MRRGRASRWLVSQWRRPTIAGRLLRPAAVLFRAAVALRRYGYRRGLLTAHRAAAAPVVVVGNLTVGGSGKTPLVIHLVDELRARGWSPGVVSRGHGVATGSPRRVSAGDDPAEVGDEPALIALRCACPVAVGAERVAAARLLAGECDVIVADDGLQHYRLARDIEVAVVDGDTGLGNARMLPAGPLREPAARLDEVDFAAVRDGRRAGAYRFRVVPGDPRPLSPSAAPRPLADWAGVPVHAVAGIGVPERFFRQLEQAGLVVERHAFADHHPFADADLAFDDGRPVLMTEKDAVKCRQLAAAELWLVPAEVVDCDGLAAAVAARLEGSDGPAPA